MIYDDLLIIQKYWLVVGGLEHFLFFHILEIMIPTDFHIFKMVNTTNQHMLFQPATWNHQRATEYPPDPSVL